MNRVPRVYLPSFAFTDHQVKTEGEVAHYLTRVLRLRPGDQWAALDGQHRSWLCKVVTKDHSQKIDEWLSVPPLPVSVEVGLALCKGSRFEDALEKLAELGAIRVVPMETERTERGMPSAQRRARWEQIARAGSALANRRVPLEIGEPRALKELLSELEPSTAVYCHHDGAPPAEVFRHPRNVYTLLIGPEGGFSPEELEKLQSRARRVSLGPLTLRVETAAVCAVSLALAGLEPGL